MAIDRADWHWESAEKLYREKNNIVGNLTNEQINMIWLYSANHIALFLRWIIDRDMQGTGSNKEDCDKVRNGQMSVLEYFFKNCDGKLWNEDIRDDILPFVKFYYDDNGYYFDDYDECCLDDKDKPCYGVITNDTDYLKLYKKIDSAYKKFLTQK